MALNIRVQHREYTDDEIPIVPSYPHYPHQVLLASCADNSATSTTIIRQKWISNKIINLYHYCIIIEANFFAPRSPGVPHL